MNVADLDDPFASSPWAGGRLPDNVGLIEPGEGSPDWGEFAPLVEDVPADAGPMPGVIDMESWAHDKAPFRRFVIPGWIIRGACGLLSGEEGVGKSLLGQQMATCAALGLPFLGLEIVEMKSAYITCEDPPEELWRRQEAINKVLGIQMADVIGQLKLVSWKGEIGNELATFDRAGRMSPTPRYRQLHASLTDFGAHLAFLDNAAHLFPGNENARHDVAAFLGLLEQLSANIDGAIVLLAHPNKQHAQGNKQGNEYSGSTGWSAHVRNRLFLDWAEVDEEGEPLDGDGRILRKSKANYGKKGEEITFRWHEWAFATLESFPPDMAAEMARNVEASTGNELFLACLDKALKDKVPTSASRAASNYAPRVFAKMPTARGRTVEQLEAALQRLLHLEKVAGDQQLWRRDNRHWVIGLGRVL